jgi:hypothetical protein
VLEWLIGLIASLLGVSPLAAVTLLVVASVGVSAVLRWHRSTRQDEYHYLNLTQQMHLAQTSGVPLDPFTLQSTEDPRLREAIAQAMQTGGAPEAAPAQAAKRETRRGPRVGVRRVPGRRA